jgi:hypothetical protein
MGEEQFVVPHRKRRRYSSFTGEICPEVPNLLGRDFHAEAESEMGNGLLESQSDTRRKGLFVTRMTVSWTIGVVPNA